MLAADVWVVITAVATVVILVLTYLLVVAGRRRDRAENEQRAEDREAADARAQTQVFAAADAELVGKTWHFEYRLRPVVGDAVPSEPPVEIVVKGANVWVHDVRLTWRYSQPALAPWVKKDAPCPPWRDGSLPHQLNSGGRPLQLGWPEPNPQRQEQIMEKIKVTYSALPDGPRREREAEGGSVAWQ